MDNNISLNLSDIDDSILDEIIDEHDDISDTTNSQRILKRKRRFHVPLQIFIAVFSEHTARAHSLNCVLRTVNETS